jgi:hypothetical protein
MILLIYLLDIVRKVINDTIILWHFIKVGIYY